ncbi:MAG TPA: hypothetical protein VMU89_13450 [Thermomicrobiaceae bacterium]|nr:hypothetical protein [Thermomicrobiaceae bacterium]
MADLTAEELRGDAELFATTVGAQVGETLDFSPSSLATLDAVVGQWLDLAGTYGDDRPPDFDAFATPAAAYLGEVLIRALGGHWVTESGPGRMVTPHVLIIGRVGQPHAPLPMRVDVLRTARVALSGADAGAFAGCFAALVAASATDAGGDRRF